MKWDDSQWQKLMREFRGSAIRNTRKAMQMVVADLSAEAKKRCPHLTGTLSRSIKPRVFALSKSWVRGTVTADTPYALRMHEATFEPGPKTLSKWRRNRIMRRMPVKYLERPLNARLRQYMGFLRKAMDQTLKGK